MEVMLTTRRRRGQSRPWPDRRLAYGRLLAAAPAAWLAIVLSSSPADAVDSTDFRIVFDLDAKQQVQAEFLTPFYADEITTIEAGSGVKVRIGIGELIAAPADADRARIEANSIWALFEHPNACNDQGCRLVHLYRDADDGAWSKGFDGYGTGELVRFYRFTGIGNRIGCIQMKDAALILFAWDEQLLARGMRC
jgi:hypothetical protein